MSIKRKMDALDFIINTLIEHEKRIDFIIERLEKNIENVEDIIKNERRLRINEIEQVKIKT